MEKLSFSMFVAQWETTYHCRTSPAGRRPRLLELLQLARDADLEEARRRAPSRVATPPHTHIAPTIIAEMRVL